MMRRFALGLALAAICGAALAQPRDAVSVRTVPGYPLPGQSLAALELRVERAGPFGEAPEGDIDRYFRRVESILAEHGVTGDWQLAVLHAPRIEITIELRGRRWQLASAHLSLERTGKDVVTERGLVALEGRNRETVLAQQSEALRRHRLAFEKLLSLTLEHARARLAP